jgi:RNA polymerase sigma-70 factor (ECF subfamily)
VGPVTRSTVLVALTVWTALPMSLALPLPALFSSRPRLRIMPPAGPVAGDEELVRRLRDGQRAAEETLYRRYAPAVLALSTRLLRRRSDAEDAAQDTFVIAFDTIHQLRNPAALRAWIMQIAVSQVRRRFRKRQLLRALGLYVGADDATLESLVAAGASAEVKADLAALDRALSGLATNERVAWMLRHVEGHELEEVACICGCSLATAKRRIAAADAQVRAEVQLGEEGAS